MGEAYSLTLQARSSHTSAVQVGLGDAIQRILTQAAFNIAMAPNEGLAVPS